MVPTNQVDSATVRPATPSPKFYHLFPLSTTHGRFQSDVGVVLAILQYSLLQQIPAVAQYSPVPQNTQHHSAPLQDVLSQGGAKVKR